ncbi:MAG: biotin transporter BioY [Pseudomonadota bacterium]
MNTKDIAYIALFAALTAALALFPKITVPIAAGVPITAQTLGVMLAGGVLGARRGALSMALFLILVAVGLPLLAGGRGGLGVFAGPSAGFLVGWIIGAFIVGWLVERFWDRLNFLFAMFACVVGGIIGVYLPGIPWLSYATDLSLIQAAIGSSAFIPGDLIKAALAAAIIVTVKRSYPLVDDAARA